MEWYYAAAIVALIALIALVAYQASGGWGAALWNAIGFFGSLLKSFLSNPILWLIGLGLLALLGPAITSIAKDQLKKLLYKVIDAESADNAKDPSDRLTEDQKRVVVEDMATKAKIEAITDSNLNEAEKQAQTNEANAYYDAQRSKIVAAMEEDGLSREQADSDADEAEGFSDEIWGIERVWRVRQRSPRRQYHGQKWE